MQMPGRKTAVSDILKADAAVQAARTGVASCCAEKVTRVQHVFVDKSGHGQAKDHVENHAREAAERGQLVPGAEELLAILRR